MAARDIHTNMQKFFYASLIRIGLQSYSTQREGHPSETEASSYFKLKIFLEDPIRTFLCDSLGQALVSKNRVPKYIHR